MFKIKEIFKSIQGEGFLTGSPAVFVRFSGCNLWNGMSINKSNAICNFCDTDFVGIDGPNGGNYNLSELLKKIDKVWNLNNSLTRKFVILTGGEPMLQVTNQLVEHLKKQGYFVAIETNGTIDSNINFDWVCVSPKNLNLWKLLKGDELKVIYPQHKFPPKVEMM